jgi:AhpD family alkylhydroperoxidase
MARIKQVDITGDGVGELDAANQVNMDVASIMAHRPEISAGIGAFTGALLTGGTLPRRLIELIRLRIAFHNQCRSCMAIRYGEALDDGVTDELVCSLESPYEADDLTDADRAALHFADLFATNHLAIDDAVYDDLRQYFTEGELVEIGMNCALDVGIGRMVATWMVTDHLSEDFQADSATFTPWGQTQLIVR